MTKRTWIVLGMFLAVGILPLAAGARDIEERVDDRRDRREVVGNVDDRVERRQDRREIVGDVDDNVERRQRRRDAREAHE